MKCPFEVKQAIVRRALDAVSRMKVMCADYTKEGKQLKAQITKEYNETVKALELMKD